MTNTSPQAVARVLLSLNRASQVYSLATKPEESLTIESYQESLRLVGLLLIGTEFSSRWEKVQEKNSPEHISSSKIAMVLLTLWNASQVYALFTSDKKENEMGLAYRTALVNIGELLLGTGDKLELERIAGKISEKQYQQYKEAAND